MGVGGWQHAAEAPPAHSLPVFEAQRQEPSCTPHSLEESILAARKEAQVLPRDQKGHENPFIRGPGILDNVEKEVREAEEI